MAARLARVARQESRQMRLDADRPHARSAAAVRDAEGLVQVEVADVRAELAGPCKPHLRVQVRAVQIDLPARLVDDVADLGHRLLEHAMGRRIGDNDGCKLRARSEEHTSELQSLMRIPYA